MTTRDAWRYAFFLGGGALAGSVTGPDAYWAWFAAVVMAAIAGELYPSSEVLRARDRAEQLREEGRALDAVLAELEVRQKALDARSDALELEADALELEAERMTRTELGETRH